MISRESFIRKFVVFNRKISYDITPKHFLESDVFMMYDKCARILLSMASTRDVVDIGAGRSWQFPPSLKESHGIHLIGIDIDGEELALNNTLDRAITADVTVQIPLEAQSVDLIMCHAGVEHFSDNEAFLKNCYAALRPGGRAILEFPSSLAPFAILNRLLPARLSQKLLRTLVPGSDGILGFEAHYDRTRYSQFADLSEKAGFKVEYHNPGYFGAGYFAFFVPLYLTALAVDLLRFASGSKNAASYNLFVLRKPGGPEDSSPWASAGVA